MKQLDGKTIKRLLKYIYGHSKGLFIAAIICVFVSTAANTGGSMFVQILIDKYIEPLLLTDNVVFTGLAKMLLLMGCVYLAGVVCTLLYNQFMVNISQGCLKSIRDDMFNHMQSLPIRYFDTHTHGDIMSHYTNDTDTLRQFISQALPQMFSCFISLVFSFAIMLHYSLVLSLLVVVVTVLIVIVTKYIAGHSTRYFTRQQTSIGNINGYIEEMLEGQKVVQVFCHEQKAEEAFDKKNEQLYEESGKANRYANILMPVLSQIGNLQYILVAIVGGGLVLSGKCSITAGVVVAFLSLSKAFSMPIQQISQQMSMVAMALAGAKRIFEMVDEEPEKDGGYVTLVNVRKTGDGLSECKEHTGVYAWKCPGSNARASYIELKGDVQLTNVDFGYTPGKLILHGVSVYAKPGQKVAFVGSTGAGKTTITNLINRFYDIDSGKITYDGIDISDIRKPDLRRSLGIVLQDTYLFTGTVIDNIRYGRLDATDEECIEAARLANADDFIKRLPNGYNTMLTGAGEDLSQGQRQLLAIARAAVANPPAMILDEATSSIDTRTEKLVQGGMDKLMEGRTTFVIAHRLSTIQNSDVIMVLDHGRIIERGDHDSLIERKGTYYQLYTGAFELD